MIKNQKLSWHIGNLRYSLDNHINWQGSSHAYYAYDVWKEGGVIYSFTHLVGGLIIAGIWPYKAWKHGQIWKIRGEGLRRYIQ